jgi:hypothetical protein
MLIIIIIIVILSLIYPVRFTQLLAIQIVIGLHGIVYKLLPLQETNNNSDIYIYIYK